MNQISIENCIKQNLEVMIQKHIKYLEYQLVMQEQKTIQFHPAEPVVKYHQKSSNSCSLSSLSSAFHSISDDRAVTALVNRIKD